MINTIQLKELAPRLSPERLTSITNAFNECCKNYNITDVNILHEFLANVLHESGQFSIKAENMNYTTPQRLVAIWSSRFTTTGEAGKLNARDFVNAPQKLANNVYARRMGNVQPNDGFAFRGGGFAQITGRDAYTLYTSYLNRNRTNKLTINQVAELVQTDDNFAMDSAFWFFCEFKKLQQLALQDNFRQLVRRWNGGFIGIVDRQKFYDKVKQILK